jgi:hypothetical protein
MTIQEYVTDKKRSTKILTKYMLAGMERMTKTRWMLFERPLIQRLLGIFLVTLTITLTMPVPFSTQPASIALCVITLGEHLCCVYIHTYIHCAVYHHAW